MERGVENYKKTNRKLAVNPSLLEISKKLHHVVSPAWVSKTDVNKDDRNRYSSWEVGNSRGLNFR